MKSIVLTIIFIIFSLLIMPNHITWAHPHVFIEQNLKIVFNEKGMSGINVHWKFDEMFSNMICEDHDKNQNGILEKAEVLSIKEKAFSYIAEFDYFIYIKINNNPFKVKYVTDFSAKIENRKLIYDFFIPCHVNAIQSFKHININAYDPNYYSAIYFADQNSFSFENKSKFEIKAQIKRDKSTLIYYDMINPWGLFLAFRVKQ